VVGNSTLITFDDLGGTGFRPDFFRILIVP